MKPVKTVKAMHGFRSIELLEARFQLAASLTLGGAQTIVPGSPVNASNDSSTWQSEMSIAVNPTDPLNLAGLSMRHTNVGGGLDAIHSC